jgi:SAM-dependent methyltransferase
MRLPFRSRHFAAAVCTQVIEHVRDPDRLLEEIGRCVRPGGMLLLSGPMYWPLHEEPHDYWRFTPYGLRVLMEKHGFDILELRHDGYAISMAVVAVNQLFRGVWFLPLRAALNTLGLFAERFIRIRHSTSNLSALARNTGRKVRIGERGAQIETAGNEPNGKAEQGLGA